MTLEVGKILQNRYRVISMLGQGGMGAVYKAWDARLNVAVALKEMIPQPGLSPEVLQELRGQFQQEAQVLARLSHPSLVRVIDFFEEQGNAYLVMDFVEGENLSERIARQGAIPEAQVLAWADQLLDAIAHCHRQNIIHRDIKPQNVIIREDGRVVLVDFGLVKLWNPNDPRTRTAMRGMGTPEYAPPEQYDTQTGHTDPRSDIYSLGATLYHALTGQAPLTATMRIASPATFQPPRALNPRISPSTEAALLRAMELAVEHRFANAEEMAAVLKHEKPMPPLVTPRRATRRGKTRLMAGAAVAAPTAPSRRISGWLVGALAVIGILILLGAIIGGGWWLSRRRASLSANATATTATIAIAESGTSLATTATDTPQPSPTSTATPISTETLTPSQSPTPTRTPRPTSTPLGGGHAGRPTPPPTPLTTPTPPATPPTETATPLPTSPSSAASNALINFEQWRTWRRGDQPYGDLTQTSEQVKTGQYAARLTYRFPAVQDDFVVFIHTIALAGKPNTLGAWVYGDSSGNYLNAWIKDAQGEIWSVHLGTVGAAGWRQMTGSIDATLSWPSGHVSGPENGIIDYPISFYALVLDRVGNGASSGTIYIDDISAWQGAPRPTSTPVVGLPTPTTGGAAPTPTSPPPPSGEVGRIFYTIEAGSAYYLATTDPAWSQGQIIGPIAYEKSTCAGGNTVTTLEGQTFNLRFGPRCGIVAPGECPSPDGVYKIVFWETHGDYSISAYTVADNALVQSIYNGKLNTQEPLLWSPDGSRFYFTINHTLHTAIPTSAGYQPVVPIAYEPHLSPDGSMILYRQPVGTVGAYDIWVANADGSNQHNVTNAPDTYKLCARWGGY